MDRRRITRTPDYAHYFYGGLHQKLVGVEGAEPIRQII